jgi:hypothetical protein
MDSNEAIGDALPSLNSKHFKVKAGREWIVFLAEDASDLPDDAVGREIRVAANATAAPVTRGTVLDTVIQAANDGVIGSAAWASLALTYKATAAFARRQHKKLSQGDVSLEEVGKRVRRAVHEIASPDAPLAIESAEFERQPDGSWHVDVRTTDGVLKAVIDSSGSVVNVALQPDQS